MHAYKHSSVLLPILHLHTVKDTTFCIAINSVPVHLEGTFHVLTDDDDIDWYVMPATFNLAVSELQDPITTFTGLQSEVVLRPRIFRFAILDPIAKYLAARGATKTELDAIFAQVLMHGY